MKAPTGKTHKPIVEVEDYNRIDGQFLSHTTDAQALSIGLSTFNGKDISAKVWRKKQKPNAKWERQSEELPLHRAFDLTILTMGSIMKEAQESYPVTNMREVICDNQDVDIIKNYYKSNRHHLLPRIEELRYLAEKFIEWDVLNP